MMLKKKSKYTSYRLIAYLLIGAIFYLGIQYSSFTKKGFVNQYAYLHSPIATHQKNSFYQTLALEAEKRLKASITYDGSYQKIDYPMGDVSPEIGVCTDVVIRAFRGTGIDLQEQVHLDMKNHFSAYPKMWGLTVTDTNIDHRRVPNLMTFFNRSKASLAISNDPKHYWPGNIVTWDLGGGNSHIGIVSSKISKQTGNPLIVHNIGDGPVLSDMLFKYKIIGHYRYGSDL